MWSQTSSAYLGRWQRTNTSLTSQCFSLFSFSEHPSRSSSLHTHLAVGSTRIPVMSWILSACVHRHKEHRQISRARDAVSRLQNDSLFKTGCAADNTQSNNLVRLKPSTSAGFLYTGHTLYQLSYWVHQRDFLIRTRRSSLIDYIFLNTLNKHTVFVFITE